MSRRLSLFIILCLALAAGSAFAYRGHIRDVIFEARRPSLPAPMPYVKPVVAETEPQAPAAEPEAAPVKAETPRPEPTPSIPTGEKPPLSETNLAVPFTSQAPHANWDMPYQEACEETSLVMADAYFRGVTSLTPDEADALILAVVAWQEKAFGYYEDTTVAEVARIAREFYGLKDVRTIEVGSIEDVKREVAEGRVVLVPASGKLLKNPYFRGEGPRYHMLVVKGYAKDGRIITNDPGTRRGADYLYDPDTLFEAIHDWNGGDVAGGAKVALSIGG